MSIGQQRRLALYARLRDVLGSEQAETLMAFLDSIPTDEVATASALSELRRYLEGGMDRLEERMDRFEERMDRLEERMDRFDDKLDGFHAALRDQTRNFILANATSMATLALIAFGAARLL